MSMKQWAGRGLATQCRTKPKSWIGLMCGYEITNFIRKDFIQYSALSIKREERFMGLSIQITDTVHVCFRKGKYIT